MRGTLCSELFRGPARSIEAFAALFRPGDAADKLFLIHTGLIKLVAVSAAGDELTIEVFGPGDVFGEMCLGSHVHVHVATALERTEITSIARDELLDRLAHRPDLLEQFLNLFTGRLAAAHSEIEARVFESTVHRLGRQLLRIAAMSPRGEGGSLPRAFGHGELARLLGVSRETVTRAIRQLRDLALVDVPSRGLVFVHQDRLADWLTSSREPRR